MSDCQASFSLLGQGQPLRPLQPVAQGGSLAPASTSLTRGHISYSSGAGSHLKIILLHLPSSIHILSSNSSGKGELPLQASHFLTRKHLMEEAPGIVKANGAGPGPWRPKTLCPGIPAPRYKGPMAPSSCRGRKRGGEIGAAGEAGSTLGWGQEAEGGGAGERRGFPAKLGQDGPGFG